jgi:hypothetical protein
VIPKGFNLKWTLNLGSNGGGDNNIKNILNDTENNHFGFNGKNSNGGHSNRIPPRNELCMHIFRGMGTGIVRKK